MDKFFSDLLNRIKNFYRTATPTQKIISIACVVGILIGIILLFYQVEREEYVVLYQNITPEEAGRIVNKLRDENYKYKLEDTTIKVPIQYRDYLRAKLAVEKFAPTGGIVGYEIFDITKIGITDYERRINFLRALQGELTRAIETIEGVEEARVLLNLPEKKFYTEEEKPVTCAIKLKLSMPLEPQQIKGIVNLVAKAVPSLSPQNITIVDQKGISLTEELDNPDMNALTVKQIKIQQLEAKKLEEKIRQRLSNVVGPDKIEVFVKYEINFDKIESREERYSMPGFEQLKVSEEKIEEDFKGEGVAPGGPPGVEAQMPAYKAAPGVGPISYQKREQRVNYLADKEEKITVKAPAPSKISIAVCIDGEYEYDRYGRLVYDKEGKPIYKPRTAEEMRKFEEMVWAAIGAEKGKIYKDREYIVRVENIQFDRTKEFAEELRKREKQRRIFILTLAAIVFSIMTLLGIVTFLSIRRRRRILEEQRRREEELRRLEEERRRLAIPEIEITDIERIALELAKRRPSVAADVVRTWLRE